MANASFHALCVARAAERLQTTLARQSPTTYTAPDGRRVDGLVSKKYGSWIERFWFGFLPSQKAALDESEGGWLALGCGDANRILLVPWGDFGRWLPTIGQTNREGRQYWHIKIANDNGAWTLRRMTGSSPVDVSKYLI